MAASMSLLSRQIARTIVDPALSGRWFAFPPDTKASLNPLPPVDATQVLCERLTASFYKTASVNRHTTGGYNVYPGFAEINDITVQFYETYDFRVTRWLQQWRLEVYDPSDGTYGLPNLYRRNLPISFFPNDSEDPVFQIVYTDIFPVEQAPFELSYAEIDGRLTVSCTFAVSSNALPYKQN